MLATVKTLKPGETQTSNNAQGGSATARPAPKTSFGDVLAAKSAPRTLNVNVRQPARRRARRALLRRRPASGRTRRPALRRSWRTRRASSLSTPRSRSCSSRRRPRWRRIRSRTTAKTTRSSSPFSAASSTLVAGSMTSPPRFSITATSTITTTSHDHDRIRIASGSRQLCQRPSTQTQPCRPWCQ